MLHNIAARSLRFWIGVGMAIAVTPITIAAVGGFILLYVGVLSPFHDVSVRQRDEIVPIQSLRILVWETLAPVDEFVDEGGGQRAQAYRELRQQIEAEFASLHALLAFDPEVADLAERAREQWTIADGIATEIVATEHAPGDPQTAELMNRMHGAIAATSDRLGAAFLLVEEEIARDHDRAAEAYRDAIWMAIAAAIVAVMTMALGVFVIGRVMASSVDRLVEGASRFAEGDRGHRIDVRVPPELRRVADEFNRMIARIQDSENALSDLARRDGLTRLLNRRAFDEALAKMRAQMRRSGERGALMLMDIDHFKRVNDTYGHAAGDEVLRAIARLMQAELRPYDGQYRIGGEEFAVLLPGLDMDMARDVAERLREAVMDLPIRTEEAVLHITASIGLALATETLDAEEMMKSADAALYRAKTAGRNRVVAIDETGLHESAAAQPTLVRDIRTRGKG